MISNQVSLTNLTLNIASGTDSGITLNKGELLGAIVQEVKDEGMLALMIKGKLVEAFSEVAFEKGQPVFLSVDDIKDGRIYLKLLTPESVARLEEASLSLNLKTIGVNQSEQSMVLAKKLLQYNLPVTQTNMNEASRAMRLLGGSTPNNMELAVMTVAGGIPVNASTMNAVAHFFSGKSDIAQLVEELTRAISPMIEEGTFTAVSSESTESTESTNTTASKAEQTTKQPAPAPTSSVSDSSTDLLQTAVRENSIDRLANTANLRLNTSWPGDGQQEITVPVLIESSPEGSEKSTSAATGPLVSERIDYPMKQTEEIIKSLLRDFIINQNEDTGEAITKLKERPQNTREFINNLVVLQDILEVTGHKNTHQAKQILNSLESLEKEIGGQQIVNTLGSGSADKQNSAYYYSFPVQAGNEFRQVQIKVQKDSSGPDLAKARSLSLVVALDTGKLGKVLFHVDWSRDGNLGIRGVVEENEVEEYLGSQVESLIGALTGLGYRVDNRGLTVSKGINQENDIKPSVNQTPSDVRILGIDIKV